jgi:hypothetical protein
MLEDEITDILRKRGILDKNASIRGLTLGPKTASAEELADMIEAALSDETAIRIED